MSMLLRARWVVDRRLEVHENAILNTSEAGGRIVRERRREGRALDLGDSILLPGLVNAHCHLDYTDMRGLIPPQRDFTAWIERINRIKRAWKDKDFARSIQRGLDESLRHGTTAIANWFCLPAAVVKTPPRTPRVWWLWEQIAIRSTVAPKRWKEELSKISRGHPLWKGGLAPHAPYTCRSEVIADVARWSATRRLPWSIHVAESEDEYEMFLRAKGRLYEFLQGLGRDMSDCGGITPLAAVGRSLLDAQSPVLLVHANHLARSDFGLLRRVIGSARAGGGISVVHCPRSHAYFDRPAFSPQRLLSIGCNVALGTDSLASAPDLSMFREMSHFAAAHPRVARRQIVRMATISGAEAMGEGKGWLKWNDWIAIRATARKPVEAWEAIVSFAGEPHFVMVDGRVRCG